jgi:hypothetical protein
MTLHLLQTYEDMARLEAVEEAERELERCCDETNRHPFPSPQWMRATVLESIARQNLLDLEIESAARSGILA